MFSLESIGFVETSKNTIIIRIITTVSREIDLQEASSINVRAWIRIITLLQKVGLPGFTLRSWLVLYSDCLQGTEAE